MLSYHFAALFATGRAPQPMGSSAQGLVPYQAFKSQDRWMVVAVFTDRMWRDLCVVIERPEWASDARFATPAQRKQNRHEIIPVLEREFERRPFLHWRDKFQAVGIPCTPVQSIDQVAQDEQVQARDLVAEVEHPRVGSMRLAGLPIKLHGTPGAIDRHPPLLGEHTMEVLGALGYSSERIESLVQSGVIQIVGSSREVAAS
jgi:crotonobetainyl-CoA:carnitine CoA-transferase CaiB-like acyl-CoA transferase